MDTNFDERQAFEDLQVILNHMYSLARKFYDEAQANQKLIDEKNETIANLRAINDEQRDKISSLAEEFERQGEDFRAHLKEYGDYNYKLTARLELSEDGLNERERQLNKRDKELSKREEDLEITRRNFEKEREQFDNEKSSMQSKLNAYDELKKQADDFDGERQKIRDEYKDRITALESERDEARNNAEILNSEKETWERKEKNLRGQIEQKDEEISRLKGNGNAGGYYPRENNSY